MRLRDAVHAVGTATYTYAPGSFYFGYPSLVTAAEPVSGPGLQRSSCPGMPLSEQMWELNYVGRNDHFSEPPPG